MKAVKVAACVIALALGSIIAKAQPSAPALGHFSKEGLSFDYPATAKLEEHATANGQQIEIYDAGTGAQIMVIVRNETIDTQEQLEGLRHDVFDFFVTTMVKEFERVQAKVERSETEIQVGGAHAAGVRLRAVLDGEPGNAEAYFVVLARRLVMVTLIGSDKELAAATTTWETVRSSLKIGPAVVSLATATTSGTDNPPALPRNDRLQR